jgi:hypothetical protein
VSDVEIVVATTPQNSSTKDADAECPAGKRVIGSGASISPVGNGHLSAIIPSADGTSVKAVAFDNADEPLNWSVTARAICARVG